MPSPGEFRILALGSPHGDDQAAWHAAARLAADVRLADAVFRLASPWEVVDHLTAERSVILLDACHGGGETGAVIRVGPCELERLRNRGGSTHGANLADVLHLAERLGRMPWRLVILAVEVETAAPGAELSRQGRQAASAVERCVRDVLSRWESVDTIGNSAAE